MDGNARKLVRAVVRRVHPDLFSSHPFACARNSQSLSILNNYVEALSNRRSPQPGLVEFYVREGEGLSKIQCELPAHGSLGPLFFAFGLISVEDLTSGVGSFSKDADVNQVDFLDWLNRTVAEASQQAAQHERLRQRIREDATACEEAFGLLSLELGGEFALSPAEQLRQMESLEVLREGLETACCGAGNDALMAGLAVRVFHPDAVPMTMTGTSALTDDGTVLLVADAERLADAIQTLDLDRARSLTRLTSYWQRRTRELASPVRDVLGVQNVWCDSRTEGDLQRFVIWAGGILQRRDEVTAKLSNAVFSFSVLVHSDMTAPMVDFLPASSVLQVRCDCPASRLLEFLASEASAAASEKADEVMEMRAEEDALLEQARLALGAKHVIRVCAVSDQAPVLAAVRRLVEAAPRIAAAIDLSDTSIAIDDCYDVWESGFISIPYDFELADVGEQLGRLLQAPRDSDGANTAGAASGSGGARPWANGDGAERRGRPGIRVEIIEDTGRLAEEWGMPMPASGKETTVPRAMGGGAQARGAVRRTPQSGMSSGAAGAPLRVPLAPCALRQVAVRPWGALRRTGLARGLVARTAGLRAVGA